MSTTTEVRVNFIADDRTRRDFDRLNRRVQTLQQRLLGLGKSIGDALGVTRARAVAGFAAAVAYLTKSAFEAGMEMDSYRNALEAVTGSTHDANQAINYLIQFSNRVGVSFTATADAYKKFAIAAKEAGMSSIDANSAFEAVTKSAAAMGLSSENTRLTLKALEQMISKGVVMAEELRGQLGEHLPGAFGLAAKAMDVSTAKLIKMMANGELFANDLLPRLAKVLEEKFGPIAVKAAEQARASLERLKNEWFLLKAKIASSGLGKAVSKILDAIAASFKFLGDNIHDVSLAFIDFAIAGIKSGNILEYGLKAIFERVKTAFYETFIDNPKDGWFDRFTNWVSKGVDMLGVTIKINNVLGRMDEAQKSLNMNTKEGLDKFSAMQVELSDLQAEMEALNKGSDEPSEFAQGLIKSLEEARALIEETKAAWNSGAKPATWKKAGTEETTPDPTADQLKQLETFRKLRMSEVQIVEDSYRQQLAAAKKLNDAKLLEGDDYNQTVTALENQRRSALAALDADALKKFQSASEARIAVVAAGLDHELALREASGASEADIANKKFANELTLLQAKNKERLVTDEQYLVERDRLFAIYNAQRLRREQMTVDEQKSITLNAMSSLGQAMMAGGKREFEVGKIISASTAMINTYQAATKALADGGAWGYAAAAAVYAAGMAQVRNIMRTKYNSGGSGGSAPSGGGFSGSQMGGGQQRLAPREIRVTGVGENSIMTGRAVLDLIRQAVGDEGNVRISYG
jgi:tape measure domain-containing protein